MITKPIQAMKKTCYTLLVGLTCALNTQAQTNEATASVPADTNSAPIAVLTETNATPAPVVTETAPAVDTNPPVVVAVGIPQIKFSDVPITTAIENLARLAGINYMLDPKIGYGLADANGQVKVEPTLSIRWENITAENALIALLDNYGLQLIHDKKTGIDRITLKDPTAPPPLFTKVIQLKYASVSNLLDAAQSVLTDKRSKVLTDARSSQLVVVGTDPEQQAVETLVAQLDKPTRQVLIETRLVEISSNPRTQKGVDWSGTLQAQQVTFGNGNSSGAFTTSFPGTGGGVNGSGNPVSGGTGSSTVGTVVNQVGNGGFSWNTQSGTTPGIGFLNASGMSAVLSFLNSSADAQIMSTPRIVTLDNELATISVTRGYPVFNVSAGSANNAGGSSVAYSNVGTILHVTPRISANDYIWLKVTPEVSSFFGNFSQTTGGGTTATGQSTTQVLTAPVFDYRTLTTQVLIPNSNTLVMGGLVQDNPKGTYTKVPVLGDMPGLGYLFRSEDKELNKDNLLIFITPTIVKDNDFQTSKSGDFLNSKPVILKQVMNPNKGWDSAQPAGDWTDPVSSDTK
jgi:type II secretory pathway component GspD/PulD (secretin)